MFCPQCGSSQSDELKFCKSCGANLHAVRNVMATRETDEKFDWSKTWVAEMLMSGEEKVRRAAEIERLEGKSPEIKRRNEIKAGIITTSVGVGLMITLYVLMEAVVLNPRIPPETAIILRSVWVAGVIPMLVGLSLIVNGVFVSKKGDGPESVRVDAGTKAIGGSETVSFLPPKADTSQLEREVFSVTDDTTRHLDKPVLKTAAKDKQ
jgi:hypothetical protein